MEEKIKKIIKNENITLANGDTCLYVPRAEKMAKEEIDFIKENKPEFLRLIPVVQKEQEIERENERIESYRFLEEKLSKILIESDDDEEKFQELMSKIKNLRYYNNDEESEGLNIAVESNKTELLQEAQKHCKHKIEIRTNRTSTNDYRKLIIRTVSCDKCHLHKQVSVSEDISGTVLYF